MKKAGRFSVIFLAEFFTEGCIFATFRFLCWVNYTIKSNTLGK